MIVELIPDGRGGLKEAKYPHLVFNEALVGTLFRPGCRHAHGVKLVYAYRVL